MTEDIPNLTEISSPTGTAFAILAPAHNHPWTNWTLSQCLVSANLVFVLAVLSLVLSCPDSAPKDVTSSTSQSSPGISQPSAMKPVSRPLWQLMVPGKILGPPTIDGDVLFLASREGVTCVERNNGKTRWSYASKADWNEVYTIQEDLVLLGTGSMHDYTLSAVERSSGTLRWTRKLRGYLSPDPILYKELLILCESNGHIAVLDRQSGALRWERPLRSRFTPGQKLLAGVLYLAEGKMLYSLDPRSGKERWHYTTDAFHLTAPLFAAGSRIYLLQTYLGGGKMLVALDRESGAAQGRFAFSCNDDKVYLYDQDKVICSDYDHIRRYSLPDLDEQWTYYTGVSSPEVVHTDRDFYYLDNHQLVALDLASGQPRWSTARRSCQQATLSAHRGRLYIHDQDTLEIYAAGDGKKLIQLVGLHNWLTFTEVGAVPALLGQDVCDRIVALALETLGERSQLVPLEPCAASQIPTTTSPPSNLLAPLQSAVTLGMYREDPGHTGDASAETTHRLPTGKLRYRHQAPGGIQTMVLEGDTLYALSFKEFPDTALLHLLDPSTGRERERIAFAANKLVGPWFNVHDNMFYSASSVGLIAIDLKKKQTLWSQQGNWYSTFLPPIYNDVLLTGREEDLAAVELNTGKVRWSLPIDVRGFATFSIVGNLAAVTSDNSMHLIELDSGKLRWTVQGAFVGIQNHAVITDASVFFCQLHYCYAFDLTNGAQRWKTELKLLNTGPLPTRDGVFVGKQNELVELDAKTGVVRWRSSVPKGFFKAFHLPASRYLLFQQLNEDQPFLVFDPVTKKERYSLPSSGGFWNAPMLYRNLLILSESSGEVLAVDLATFTERYRFSPGLPVNGQPIVTEQAVFLTGQDSVTFPEGHLVRLDRTTGTETWKSAWRVSSLPPLVTDRAVLTACENRSFTRPSGVLLYDSESGKLLANVKDYQLTTPINRLAGRLFFGLDGGRMNCLDEATGREVWSFKTGGDIHSAPSLDTSGVYFGSEDHVLYALEQQSGALRWTFATAGPLQATPAVRAGVVYAADQKGLLYAVDTAGGTLRWKFKTEGPIVADPAVSKDLVVLASTDHRLYALDASSGKLVWVYRTGGSIFSSPSIADGRMYVGSDDKKLHAINLSTGTPSWTFETGGPVRSTPTIRAGVVYVGSQDGYLYALE